MPHQQFPSLSESLVRLVQINQIMIFIRFSSPSSPLKIFPMTLVSRSSEIKMLQSLRRVVNVMIDLFSVRMEIVLVMPLIRCKQCKLPQIKPPKTQTGSPPSPVDDSDSRICLKENIAHTITDHYLLRRRAFFRWLRVVISNPHFHFHHSCISLMTH